MPSSFRDPKQLPQWMELDYHTRRRPLRRRRKLICWVVFLGCLGGTVAAVFIPRAKLAYQAAPVSPSHAMFNHECSLCHQESFQTAKRIFSPGGDISAVPDQACIQCHEGPVHNMHVKVNIACAECHQEHRGRDALSRVPDGLCLRCHEDLASHRKGGSPDFQNITGFPEGHPDFKMWQTAKKDEANLNFNHQHHLNPKGLDVQGKVRQLDCADCHSWDEAGKYMQPIVYEKHCAECHKLPVKLGGQFNDPELKKAAKDFESIPAPHEEPRMVQAMLRERLLGFVQRNPVVLDRAIHPRPLPGRLRPISPAAQEWAKLPGKIKALNTFLFVDQQMDVAQSMAFKSCGKCHIQEGTEKKLDTDPTAVPIFKETKLPKRWLEHALFDHRAHRMLNCSECHQKVKDSKLTSDILMPKMASCAQCHNKTVGVPHDCAECHQYHLRDLTKERHKDWMIEGALHP